jgi:N-acetylglucosamine kinase-like BadF-type ATPase
MKTALVVDGGASKTDLALVRDDGEVLALVRGGGSSPHHVGLVPAMDLIADLATHAASEAGIEPPFDLARLFVAGVDLPIEVDRANEEARRRGWSPDTLVDNDTFAVLRAGSESGWGIAVVCGTGLNCLGVSPDGHHARFPALGWTTGDWGGGPEVGAAAVSAAARSEDGRGPRTTLERRVPAHFGLATPRELAEAIHFGRVDPSRATELVPLVLAEAADDAVAASIRDRLAAEVVALVRVAVQRLGLADLGVEVVLGGGIFQAGDPGLLASVRAGILEIAPLAVLRSSRVAPVYGAALAALDSLGASAQSHSRLLEQAVPTPEVTLG